MMPERAVVFFVHSLPRFVADFGALARHLINAGVRVTIYAPASTFDVDGPASLRAAELHGASIIELPIRRGRRSPMSIAAAAWQSLRCARSSPRAVAVFWNILPIVSCGLPARALNRRCIFLVTGLGSVFSATDLRLRVLRGLTKRLYRYLFTGPKSRVIVHNHEDRDYLVKQLQVPAEHVTVTPGCGIDPREYPLLPMPPDRRSPIVLVTARLLLEKGILDAVAASVLLSRRGVTHELWFSCCPDQGNPSSLRPRDIERVEASHPWIRFLGFQPSVLPLLARCAVVCVPTRYREGLPTSVLEAAACARPIVATDNVGCREFIDDGVTGLMVEPGNPRALAHALQRVLTNRTLAERLRLEAHARFLDGFTKADMVTRSLAVFRELGLEPTSQPTRSHDSENTPERQPAPGRFGARRHAGTP